MTDLNKILDDIQSAIEFEMDKGAHKTIIINLNLAENYLATAVQLKEFHRMSGVNIDALGLPNDRTNHGRRASDKIYDTGPSRGNDLNFTLGDTSHMNLYDVTASSSSYDSNCGSSGSDSSSSCSSD